MKLHRKKHQINSAFILFLLLIMGFLINSCQKEELSEKMEETESVESVDLRWQRNKIKICFKSKWRRHPRIIRIRPWTWKWFKKHGAVRLDDQDDDGFVPDNACGFGTMGDCDDNDPLVNPDFPGSCGDGIDSDGDGVLDEDDECPDEVGLEAFNGCPDADGDGIPDKEDECPTEAGPAQNGGCPWPDTDGDGVLDRDDQCPQVAGTVANNGCPEVHQ
ncbi:MAG: thrombospondin type 3 repeat-containing protein [Bacteroidota bacterium]